MTRRAAPMLALLLALTSAHRDAAAEPPDSPTSATEAADGDDIWNDGFVPVHWAELVATGVVLGSALLVEVYMEPSLEPNWTRAGPVDERFRVWLRGRTHGVRDRADLISDIGWYGLGAYPLIDAIIVGGAARRRWDVAFQLTAMWVEAVSLSYFISRLTQRGFKRARPLTLECVDDPGYSTLCDSPGRNSSFIGGHTAGAMVGAGQVCAVHQFTDLYRSDLAGSLACAGAVTVGVLTAVFRTVADKHWMSDSVIGGLIGFGIGYIIPYLHFTLGGPIGEQSGDDAGIHLSLVPVGDVGIGIGGRF